MENQITSIAIKVGELGVKYSITFWVAIIGACAAIISAMIAGFFAWKLNLVNKQHEKQWAYVSKVSMLIDNGIDIFARLLFNKLLIAYGIDTQVAKNNLFLLQKDILVVESQLIVYGSLNLGKGVYDFKNSIIQTPDADFVKEWGNIYQKGHDLLLLCRKELGDKLSEKFGDFTNKLTKAVPEIPLNSNFDAQSISSTRSTISIEKLKEK